MAISLKTAGTWAEYTADGTVTIPGSPAAGDRMFLFASWKDFAITASVSGWTTIGAEFTDGAVSAGNGTGSMKVQAWYRDWITGDSNPTLDFSSSPTIGAAVIQLWTKGATDTWNDPSSITAAIAANTVWSATASTTVNIPSGAVVMELVGIRDDSATFTRNSLTAIEDNGSPNITWSASYVESPAAHLSTTTGFDMAADLGHRDVIIGGTGVTLTATGTLAASETGAVKWVVQGLGGQGFAQAGGYIKALDIEAVGQAQAQIKVFGANKFAQAQGRILGSILPWTYFGTKRSSDEVNGDRFGSSVALSKDGSVLVIGAYGRTTNTGRVYVYSGTNWSTETILTASTPGTNRYYGISVAVSDDGSVIVVGSSVGADEANRGRAYVHYGTNWGTTTELNPATAPVAGESYGYAVGISGDGTVAAVGAYSENVADGVVYIFSGSSYSTETKKTPGVGQGGEFGWTVDLSYDGSFIVTGGDQYGTGSQGAIAVFYDTGWSTTTIIEPVSPTADEGFGLGVSISNDGSKIYVTSWKHSTYGAFTQLSGTNWTTQTVTNYPSTISGQGSYMGASENGAYFVIDGATGAIGDTVRVYGPNTWGKNWEFIPDSLSGLLKVAISSNGQVIVAGRTTNSDTGTNRGAVYIWTRPATAEIGQAQASITLPAAIPQAYAQAQSDIKQTYNGFAQSQADIKQTYLSFAQAQACVIGWAFANVQADIKQTYNLFAQAQTQIKQTYNAFAQSQADIKQTYNSFAQSQADIKTVGYGFAQAQAEIKQTYHSFAQANANILQVYQGYAQAQARIQQTYNAFSQAQADIKAVGYGFAQSQAKINAFAVNGFGQALGNIKGLDIEGVGQAQAKINAFAVNGYGQSQADIKATYTGCGQAQAQIIETRQGYSQAQTDILATYQGYANAQANIKATSNGYGQTQADIKQTYQGYAQSQADIKQIYYGFGQANADIKATSNPFAQAQADILNTYFSFANAQADILVTYYGFANAQARILSTYNGFAQAQGSIKSTVNAFAQAQAKINAFNVRGYANAQTNIAGITYPSGQAQAQINAFAVKGFAQSQANIRATSNGYGQSQAAIKQIYNGYAQGQGDILVTYFGFAQAQATIRGNAFAQAQGYIQTAFYGFAQAQALIAAATNNVSAQSQADILATSNKFGQTQADIKTTYNGFGQAQGTIKQTSQGYAQAQGYLKRIESGEGQAQSTIKNTYNSEGQAQSNIKATYTQVGQGQADIKITSVVFAQAQGNITNLYQGYAQSTALITQIYTASGQAQTSINAAYSAFGQVQTYIITVVTVAAQAQTYILAGQQYGYAQAFIRISHYLKKLVLSERESVHLTLSDRETPNLTPDDTLVIGLTISDRDYEGV